MIPRHRLTWAVVAVLLLAQAVLVAGQLRQSHAGAHSRAHHVPIAVRAPAILAQTVAAHANAVSGGPVDARVLAGSADPRATVRDGRATAVLVVDLTAHDNVLYLSTAGSASSRETARSVASSASTLMDRPLDVRTVPPRHHPDVSTAALVRVAATWVLLGFVLGIGVALLPALAGRGRRRVLTALGAVVVLAAVSAVVAAATSGAPLGLLLGVGVLVSAAAALLSCALTRLLGLLGTAVSATVLVFLTAPLLSVGDPRLLGSPWRQLVPWTPYGAGVELLTRLVHFGRAGTLRPTLVLAGIVVVAGAGLVIGARLRRRTPAAELEGPEGRLPARRRLHLVAGIAPVALGLVAALALLPSGPAAPAADHVAADTETSCVPKPKITTVPELNHWIQSVRGSSSFQGADVGADALLQDGRRVWLFGDTLRGDDFDGQQFVRNSMLVLDRQCLRTVLPADHGAVIPDRDGRTASTRIGYWPMSVAVQHRTGYDLLAVTAQRVRSTGAATDAFAFENLGPSIAVFLVTPGGTPQLIGQHDIGPDDAATTRPMWGAATAAANGWVYLYGTARPDEKGVFGFSLQVARSRPDDLLDASTWQYWDGHRWQSHAAKAAVLIPAVGGVSQTLSVFERDGTWYAVSKRDEVYGTDLVIWRASSPTGPFDAGTTVAKIPSDASGELRYMPLAHPTLLPQQGHLLVSYSRNNANVTKVQDDPFLYRPEFLEVRLPTGG